jgi:hypothetical protein
MGPGPGTCELVGSGDRLSRILAVAVLPTGLNG